MATTRFIALKAFFEQHCGDEGNIGVEGMVISVSGTPCLSARGGL